MNFDIKQIVAEMNVFALAVVIVLGIMALATLSIFVERWWSYWRNGRRAKKFGPIAAGKLRKGDHKGLIKAADEAPPSYLASMVGAGMRSYIKAVEKPGDVPAVELVKRELLRKGDAQALQLKRGLPVLASVGSTAPFVGLLGTVIGIISAFQGIATEGSGGLGAVSAGIAEALVVTAFGLMVAIPATLIFNFLSTKSDGIMLRLDQAQGEFVDHIESHHSEYASTLGAERTMVADAPEASANAA